MNNPKKIAVIGAGFMGCVIATLYARHGYEVALHDVLPSMLADAATRARPIAESLADDAHSVDDILAAIVPHSDLSEALDGAFLVQEAVQENLAVKQAVFAELDRLCPPSVVLGTNTSSYLLSDICSGVSHRERVIGIHYVTPAHLVPVVEIITAPFTPPEKIRWTRDFLETVGKVGVVCAERPGFLVNRLQYALLAEAYRLLDEGLATRDDIDAAVRLSLGPRLALWGPLLTEDLVVNKTTVASVCRYLVEQTGNQQYLAGPTLTKLVDEGKLGASVGEGWYTFASDYQSVLRKRDAQLGELLAWLGAKAPLATIGIA